ncbi:hypothetical protein LINPERHAP1_LOCUS31936 [Linum perenne]
MEKNGVWCTGLLTMRSLKRKPLSLSPTLSLLLDLARTLVIITPRTSSMI